MNPTERTTASRAQLRRMGYAEKVYHFAALFSENGGVSALCYARPRAINLKDGQSWTIREDAVTCKRCLAAMERRAGDSACTGRSVR